MRTKLECPTSFLEPKKFESLAKNLGLVLDDNNPEVVVVNPGTNQFLDEKYFSSFVNLKIVATPSTGTNHIDVKALESRGVKTICLLDDRTALDSIHASAEFTWIHIMNLMRKFSLSLKHVDSWREETNESFLRSKELHGKKIGIVGLGRIGRKISKYASAFGMHVFFYDPYVDDENFNKVQDLSQLSSCDVISINCYLTPETKGMITYGAFDNVAPGTIIINTSRGEVVDENYLLYLIDNNGVYFGADVLQNEQDIEKLRNSKLLKRSKFDEKVVITPHIAGATLESQYKALEAVLCLSRKML